MLPRHAYLSATMLAAVQREHSRRADFGPARAEQRASKKVRAKRKAKRGWA
jgi:hypothetical protein